MLDNKGITLITSANNITRTTHFECFDEDIDSMVNEFALHLMGQTWLPKTVYEAFKRVADDHLEDFKEDDYEGSSNQ